MFEEFPFEEYQRRVEATRDQMRERGIDALLLTTEIGVRYLAGLVDCYWVAILADVWTWKR